MTTVRWKNDVQCNRWAICHWHCSDENGFKRKKQIKIHLNYQTSLNILNMCCFYGWPLTISIRCKWDATTHQPSCNCPVMSEAWTSKNENTEATLNWSVLAGWDNGLIANQCVCHCKWQLCLIGRSCVDTRKVTDKVPSFSHCRIVSWAQRQKTPFPASNNVRR